LYILKGGKGAALRSEFVGDTFEKGTLKKKKFRGQGMEGNGVESS